MRSLGAVVLTVIVLTAGCLGTPEPVDPADVAAPTAAPTWDTTGTFSRVLTPGTLGVLPVERLDLMGFDGTNVAAAVWRPDVPDATKVPVIVHASPYFGESLASEDRWTEEFWIENFVKHGFAYAKVATRGTSFSGGCIEWWGPNEAKDLDAMVTHFGTMDWSNGNVGMVGLSYPGGAAWMAASFGNPHLKTIIVAGSTADVGELHYLNGTIGESISPVEHGVTYWALTAQGGRETPSPRWAEAACEEWQEGLAAGPAAAVDGDISATSPFAAYWAERDYKARVLENYRGSVYVVHGIHDYTNELRQVYPLVNHLEDRGVRVQHMLGQWGHTWPDFNTGGDRELRWDFAERLLAWFDAELRDGPAVDGPGADVQDNLKAWRTEDTWPPRDATWTSFSLGDGTIGADPAPEGASAAADPVAAATLAGRWTGVDAPTPHGWTFTTGPLTSDLRFAGAPQVHLTVTPLTPAGELYVMLLHRGADGDDFLTRGVMDLRYHTGGKAPQDIEAGVAVRAHMMAEPVDVVIPAGDELVLVVLPAIPTVGGLEPTTRNAAPLELSWGGDASVLRLPLIERDVGDGTYPGQPPP